MEAHYNLIFRGEIAEGQNLVTVKKNLAAMFKLTTRQIEETFAGKPLLVKDHVDYQTALKYKAAFEKAGTVCQIQPATQVSKKNYREKPVDDVVQKNKKSQRPPKPLKRNIKAEIRPGQHQKKVFFHEQPQEICFFCGKYPTKDSTKLKIPIYKTFSAEEISWGTEIEYKYQTRTVSIPRCQNCSRYRKKTFAVYNNQQNENKAFVLVPLCFISFIVCASFIGGLFEVAAIMRLAGIVVSAAIFVLSLISAIKLDREEKAERQNLEKQLQKEGIKPFDEYKQFPEFQKAKEEGWNTGESPAEVLDITINKINKQR